MEPSCCGSRCQCFESMESVVSASLIVLVIRSRKPFFKSRPGKFLALAIFLCTAVTLILPYTPLAGSLGFSPLPPLFFVLIGILIALYILLAEVAKKIFYRLI